MAGFSLPGFDSFYYFFVEIGSVFFEDFDHEIAHGFDYLIVLGDSSLIDCQDCFM